MKIIFFGLGSIGQRHAKILLKHYKHNLYAFRSGVNNSPNNLGIKEVHSWDEVIRLAPDVSFITNPTSLHIKTSIKCAEMGCKLFMEKPIGGDLDRLEELLKIIKNKKLVTYLAYNLRFHPIITFLKKIISKEKPLHLRAVCASYYPNWRGGRDYLNAYSAKKKMGGGVILDLSHELDYVSYLLGGIKIIKGSFSRRSNVTVDAEDYADFVMECKGVPVNIHINFFSQLLQRNIQIDFPNLTLVGDLINSEILEYKNQELKKRTRLKSQKGQSYKEQIKYFFDNIDNPKMMNNLLEASELFKKIIDFKNE